METIGLPISLYIVETTIFVPSLTVPSLTEILEAVNAIWAQADIQFTAKVKEAITLPSLRYSNDSWKDCVMDEAINRLQYDEAIISGSYTKWGKDTNNGFSLPRAKFGYKALYVVKDKPELVPVPNDIPLSTDDTVARVSGYELGHILGLNRFRSPESEEDRLMFSGSNGIRLTLDEISTARAKAQWLLNPRG